MVGILQTKLKQHKVIQYTQVSGQRAAMQQALGEGAWLRPMVALCSGLLCHGSIVHEQSSCLGCGLTLMTPAVLGGNACWLSCPVLVMLVALPC